MLRMPTEDKQGKQMQCTIELKHSVTRSIVNAEGLDLRLVYRHVDLAVCASAFGERYVHAHAEIGNSAEAQH